MKCGKGLEQMKFNEWMPYNLHYKETITVYSFLLFTTIFFNTSQHIKRFYIYIYKNKYWGNLVIKAIWRCVFYVLSLQLFKPQYWHLEDAFVASRTQRAALETYLNCSKMKPQFYRGRFCLTALETAMAQLLSLTVTRLAISLSL